MRTNRPRWIAALAAALLLPAGARAQAPAPVLAPGQAPNAPYAATPLGVYDAPGNYGVAWGTASFGMVRSYSAFSSPYGAGYGYGYAPYRILPGAYGTGLWSPGTTLPAGALERSDGYRVFPVPYGPAPQGAVPPLGAYAPAFGPPAFQMQGR
jgi:hypothetical protein